MYRLPSEMPCAETYVKGSRSEPNTATRMYGGARGVKKHAVDEFDWADDAERRCLHTSTILL